MEVVDLVEVVAAVAAVEAGSFVYVLFVKQLNKCWKSYLIFTRIAYYHLEIMGISWSD